MTDRPDDVWTGSAFAFERREIGLVIALRNAWARLLCRIFGHDWKHGVWFEGYDHGCGYEEEWWECGRCELWTDEDPT